MRLPEQTVTSRKTQHEASRKLPWAFFATAVGTVSHVREGRSSTCTSLQSQTSSSGSKDRKAEKPTRERTDGRAPTQKKKIKQHMQGTGQKNYGSSLLPKASVGPTRSIPSVTLLNGRETSKPISRISSF